MSTIAYHSSSQIVGCEALKPPRPRQGLWSRLFARVAEARLRQAEQYLASHRYLWADFDRDHGSGGR